jgi:hypothetical protein
MSKLVPCLAYSSVIKMRIVCKLQPDYTASNIENIHHGLRFERIPMGQSPS